MQLREQVEWFSFEMEKVLQANDHKEGLFDYMSLDSLMYRLQEEMEELEELLTSQDDSYLRLPEIEEEDREAIKREAVDVANFAMAIAWAVRK